MRKINRYRRIKMTLSQGILCTQPDLIIYIRGASISFQTFLFFLHAFKIVVDSWKFSMLLLYILWDGWVIFMISGSNEQLQQELENTLLKPDWHSWWISKMQSGREDTLEERYTIKFCFKLGKMPQKRLGCFRLLLEHLRWIKHKFLSGIRDSRKAESLWGMMLGVGEVRNSIHIKSRLNGTQCPINVNFSCSTNTSVFLRIKQSQNIAYEFVLFLQQCPSCLPRFSWWFMRSNVNGRTAGFFFRLLFRGCVQNSILGSFSSTFSPIVLLEPLVKPYISTDTSITWKNSRSVQFHWTEHMFS